MTLHFSCQFYLTIIVLSVSQHEHVPVSGPIKAEKYINIDLCPSQYLARQKVLTQIMKEKISEFKTNREAGKGRETEQYHESLPFFNVLLLVFSACPVCYCLWKQQNQYGCRSDPAARGSHQWPYTTGSGWAQTGSDKRSFLQGYVLVQCSERASLSGLTASLLYNIISACSRTPQKRGTKK